MTAKGDERTFRIDLGYDGTDYFGSQRQLSVPTIQSEVESALSKLVSGSALVAFAGRTDRGVHAVGQVVSARLRWGRSEESLQAGLQALTPDSIGIYKVRVVDDRFHARFSARRREYRYRIWNGSRPAVLLGRYVWQVKDKLDLDSMNAASAHFEARQDFSSVAGGGLGTPGSNINCIREVYEANWRTIESSFEQGAPTGRLLEFRIQADAFLPHMVRNIVGELVSVGRGTQRPEWMRDLLSRRDRRAAVAPAPSQGLVLWQVRYDDDSISFDGASRIAAAPEVV